MKTLAEVFYTLFWTFIMISISAAAFNFFGIGVQVYGIYIMWFACISILGIFLPDRVGLVFYN